MACCLVFCVNSVFGLPSDNIGEMHPYTSISVNSVRRQVEAGPSNVVKHMQVTTKHAVALVDKSDVSLGGGIHSSQCVHVYIGFKLKRNVL